VLSVVRTADLVVFMLSVFEIEQYDRLREELYNTRIFGLTPIRRTSISGRRTKTDSG